MQSNALMALGMGVIVTFIIISVLISVLMIVAHWFVYTKAGQPGWAVLIPIYNFIVLLKIVGRPVWWIFLVLQVILFEVIFILNPGILTGVLYGASAITTIFTCIIIVNGLSKSFGKDAGFTVGLIFLGFIFYPILGFGKAKYIGPGGIPPTADTPADSSVQQL